MIQDISPYKFHVEYADLQPQEKDLVLMFTARNLLIRDAEEIAFAFCEELPDAYRRQMNYLFAIDEMRFFYLKLEEQQAVQMCENGFRPAERQEFRRLMPKHLAFAAVSAFQLHGWYEANRFCGRCGKELVQDKKERMLRCPHCQNLVYPRINPAVIVAVTDHEKLLLTRYNGRAYQSYALVAGFVEIGESFEDTVRREVMEEAGLHIKNIRYYGSQPWAFADNILAGYICEVDGDSRIVMDEEELSEAVFISREEIPVEYSDSSLTNEMICAFKNRKY